MSLLTFINNREMKANLTQTQINQLIKVQEFVDKLRHKSYDELWSELDEWCCNNLKGKDLEYFYKTTD